MQKITPFLWFDTNAEDAVNYYASIFKDTVISHVARQGANGPVITISFSLNGQAFIALNGGPHFKFTEAVSFVISCENQEEIDCYWDHLSEGGSVQQCGWLKDKFGLSWQVVPANMGTLMTNADPSKSTKVMQAMMKMVKLDIATLEEAGR